MTKKFLLATGAVFVAWELMDWVLHGVLLKSLYAASEQLWRPEAEMKMGLLFVVALIAAAAFTYVYARFFGDKGLKVGALYGLVVGVGAGASMGHGSYAIMDIPYFLALGWFLGTLAECVVGGAIVGAIIKD